MTIIEKAPQVRSGFSRRAVLAAAAAGAGAVVLAGPPLWRRLDLRSRLFNPFTTGNFALDPVAGVQLASGEPAPGFSASDLPGQVTVLNFWASWCPPCIGEHPHLVALARDRRFRIFGANYKDTHDGAARFLDTRGNPYSAVGDDRHGFVSRAFGARGVPWTFVLDRTGSITFALPGALDGTNLRSLLIPAIEKALRV